VPHILIVEDSPTIRAMLAALFHAEADVQVVGMAADGEEGVRIVQRLRPDVVTMDINMPRKDGLTAIGEIGKVSPHTASTSALIPAPGSSGCERELKYASRSSAACFASAAFCSASP